MRLGYTAQQVRDAERPHLDAGEPLMQRAAHGLARRILSATDPGRVLLLVGSGDNGGDALFAGAELAEARREVHALGVGSRMHGAGREAAVAAGVCIVSPDEVDALVARLAEGSAGFDVIVDGILGIGAADGGLRGDARRVVQALLPALQRDGAPVVVAVDLPSGVHPDTGGTADDVVLPASVTVTFGAVKAGLLRGRGAELAGEVVLVPIGIEHDLEPVVPAIRVD